MTYKIGRNEPCPCGSGQKFKKCCYGKDMSEFAHPATFSSHDTVVNELVGSVSQINRLTKRIAELDTQIREMKGEIPAGYLAHNSGLPILSEVELNRWSTLICRYRPPVASRIPELPWTKQDWTSIESENLDEFDPFWNFAEQLLTEQLADEGRTIPYLQILLLMLFVDSNTDLDVINDSWLEEQTSNLELSRERLLNVAQMVLQVQVLRVLGLLETFEFYSYANGFISDHLEELEITNDTEFDGLMDEISFQAMTALRLAIDEHYDRFSTEDT